jgi:hypothetical protein
MTYVHTTTDDRPLSTPSATKQSDERSEKSNDFGRGINRVHVLTQLMGVVGLMVTHPLCLV